MSHRNTQTHHQQGKEGSSPSSGRLTLADPAPAAGLASKNIVPPDHDDTHSSEPAAAPKPSKQRASSKKAETISSEFPSNALYSDKELTDLLQALIVDRDYAPTNPVFAHETLCSVFIPVVVDTAVSVPPRAFVHDIEVNGKTTRYAIQHKQNLKYEISQEAVLDEFLQFNWYDKQMIQHSKKTLPNFFALRLTHSYAPNAQHIQAFLKTKTPSGKHELFEVVLQQKQREHAQMQATIQEKDVTIAQLLATIEEKDVTIAQLQAANEEKGTWRVASLGNGRKAAADQDCLDGGAGTAQNCAPQAEEFVVFVHAQQQG